MLKYTITIIFTFTSHITLAFSSNEDTLFAKIPASVTNNAVAQVHVDNKDYFISFSGLSAGKTYKDVHNDTFVYDVSKNHWEKRKPVPIEKPIKGLTGRLASVAAAIGDTAYIFGGYTVAKNHSEVSIPDVYSYSVQKDSYQKLAPMPVPVDDSVAFTYQDRYIYLISGWHNDGNVNLSQVYDTQTDTWQQASPFPGKPVFGHAGGIVNNTLIICDGVRIDVFTDKRRRYAAESACYRGDISIENPHKISWFKIPHPTGISRYRMAALGIADSTTSINEVVFVGGSQNPYNYNGIGYNQKPSSPSKEIWRYNTNSNQWLIENSDQATMDHRGLLKLNNSLLTIGGMGKNQRVLNTINQY